MAQIEGTFVHTTTLQERDVLADKQFEIWLARRLWAVSEVNPLVIICDDQFVAVDSAALRAQIYLALDIAGYCHHDHSSSVEMNNASVV